jgi:hypothetical protein
MIDAALGVATVVVAALAGWTLLPREPELDLERLFKVAIANALLGRVEREGGDAVAWATELRRFVPYHPAGRELAKKLDEPSAWRPPAGGALEGEVALVEALARCPDLAARWVRLFHEDGPARDALLVDPQREPSLSLAALGADITWEKLIRAPDELTLALRRAQPAPWILVGDDPAGTPALLGALAGQLGPLARRVRESPDPDAQALASGLAEAWTQLGAADARVVVVAAGDSAASLLSALSVAPGFRDRVECVVLLGGNLGGREGVDGEAGVSARRDWLERTFRHGALDTERAQVTPYLSLAWADPSANRAGWGDLSLQAQSLPTPADSEAAPWGVRPVALGVLPPEPDLPVADVALALWLTVARLTCSRRLG